MTFDFLAMKTTSTMERRAEKEQLREMERAKAQIIEQVIACLFFHLCIRKRKRGHVSMLGLDTMTTLASILVPTECTL